MSLPESWVAHGVPDSGRLALDVGANVGVWAEYLAERFTEVMAFEPNPGAVGSLRGEVAAAGLSNVTVVESAVGDKSGKLTLNTYPQTQHTSALELPEVSVAAPAPLGQIVVDVVTVDELELEPDFIKIDTEGFELPVLKGAKRTLKESGPALVIEVHGHFAKDSRDRACERLLEPLGYTCEGIPHPGGPYDDDPEQNYYWLLARR